MFAIAFANATDAAPRAGLAASIALHAAALLASWQWHGTPDPVAVPAPLMVRLIGMEPAGAAHVPLPAKVQPNPQPNAQAKAQPKAQPNAEARATATPPGPIFTRTPAVSATSDSPVLVADASREVSVAPAATEGRQVPAPGATPGPVPAQVIPPGFHAGYLDNPAPAYPSLSRRMGEEGLVTLRVQVDSNGMPLRVEIRASSGSERLDHAAVDAVRRWKFVPARQGVQPVAAHVLVPISFSLRG